MRDDYLCPLKWDRLIASWLSEDPKTRTSLKQFALTEGAYGELDLR
ncbi:MAG: hypothetical protein AAF997_23510 [Myxococcota bacterium]